MLKGRWLRPTVDGRIIFSGVVFLHVEGLDIHAIYFLTTKQNALSQVELFQYSLYILHISSDVTRCLSFV